MCNKIYEVLLIGIKFVSKVQYRFNNYNKPDRVKSKCK